jgi:HK97 family phage major capsid protein
MKELLEKRAKVFEDARAIVLKAEEDKRSLTSEEYTKWRGMMDEVEAIGNTINARHLTTETDERLKQSIGPRQSAQESRLFRGDTDERGYTEAEKRAWQQFALPADKRTGDEFRSLGIVQPGISYTLPGGRSINGDMLHINLRAASPLSDVTGAAGAYTVPQGFVYNLEKNLKWFGGIRAANPTILRTATGNPLPWPTTDDTGNMGEITAENAAAGQATTEMSFGQVMFGAYKYDSQVVKVPIELIQDSAFDVQAIVFDALGRRIGRKQNTDFTVGTGTSQPKGVVTAATLGVTGTTGQTAKVLYADFVNLEHSVDPWYRANGKYMMHDSTAASVEALVDTQGRPLLNSSFAGISADVFAARPDGVAPAITRYTIKGYPVVINNDMATMAANAKSVLFGDFSKYVVRDVMDIMLIRFNELYMGNLQVGFLAVARADGNLVDAGAHPIKYYANSAT